MGFFNFLGDRNGNKLTSDEIEAAEILKNLVNGLITNGVDKFSIGLYYLALKRSNKKLIKFEDLLDPMNFIANPKLVRYFGVYAAIRETIDNFCNNPSFRYYNQSPRECEASILTVLQQAAKSINEI